MSALYQVSVVFRFKKDAKTAEALSLIKKWSLSSNNGRHFDGHVRAENVGVNEEMPEHWGEDQKMIDRVDYYFSHDANKAKVDTHNIKSI